MSLGVCRDSKDFAFMYDKDQGWTQEKYYNLRSHSVLKSSYRKGRDDKYGRDFCDPDDRQDKTTSWLSRLCTLIGLVLLAVLLYYVFLRKTPYCEVRNADDASEHCAYEDVGIFAECKPCPWNATCSGT